MTLTFITEIDLRAKLSYRDGVSAVIEAFEALSDDKVIMPPIQQLAFPEKNGSTCVKSAGINGSLHFTVKIASGFCDNMKKTNGEIANGSGIMVVFSAEYGAPVAIIQDNGWLTDLRTAAAGALVAKLCSRWQQSRGGKVAILGTGVQARMQLEAISEVVNIGEANIWGRTGANRDKLVDSFNESDHDFEVTSAESVTDCVRNADIIVCTTASIRGTAGIPASV